MFERKHFRGAAFRACDFSRSSPKTARQPDQMAGLHTARVIGVVSLGSRQAAAEQSLTPLAFALRGSGWGLVGFLAVALRTGSWG